MRSWLEEPNAQSGMPKMFSDFSLLSPMEECLLFLLLLLPWLVSTPDCLNDMMELSSSRSNQNAGIQGASARGGWCFPRVEVTRHDDQLLFRAKAELSCGDPSRQRRSSGILPGCEQQKGLAYWMYATLSKCFHNWSETTRLNRWSKQSLDPYSIHEEGSSFLNLQVDKRFCVNEVWIMFLKMVCGVFVGRVKLGAFIILHNNNNDSCIILFFH